MKIKSIRAVQLELPATGPLAKPAKTEYKTARRPSWVESGSVANPMTRYPRYADYRPSWTPSWPDFGCVVEAEDGTWGLSTANHGRPVAALIDDYLGPRLIGENCFATEKSYDMMVRMGAPFGATGLHAYAISAIDLALWDLKGKILDRPVYELLGGPAHDELFCYSTGGDTDWYMELGFPATKLPCPCGPADGVDGLEKNIELVAKTREQVGPKVELMLDCWMAFDVEYAVRLAEELRPYKLKWMEEMLRSEDVDAHAQLRQRVPWQTLATGEHWYGTTPFQHAASRHLVDIFQPDINWVGGLTAITKICSIAEAAGISVIPHGGGNTPYGQHACYALPAIPWTECFVATPPGVPPEEAVRLPGMVAPQNGRMVPSDRPGFGVQISEEHLAPFAY
jgi:L-rhamnonate dehydratase